MNRLQAGDTVYRLLSNDRMLVMHVYETEAGAIAWVTYSKDGKKNTNYFMASQLFVAKR